MKVTTLIPTTRNDGTPVDAAEQDQILQEIWTAFGGVTVEGMTQGTWVDGADIYHDACLKVVVNCEDPQRYPEVEALILSIGKRLGQLAMWIEVQYFDGARIVPVD